MPFLKVNLLPLKKDRTFISKKWLNRFNKSSYIILALYALLLTGIFFVRFFFNQAKQNTQTQIDTTTETIKSFANIESQHILVKSKLQVAKSILEQRKSWHGLVSSVLEFIPDISVLNSLSLGPENDFSLTISTPKLQEFVVVLTSLQAINLQNNFVNNIVLESVHKSEKGFYSFTLKFDT